MSDEYFHIRTKDVRKIAEAVYESLAEMLGWGEFGFEDEVKNDITKDIMRIINKYEKKLGD